MPALEEVDVCIVGSGAGGAPIALQLARAGAKVVVLEKGPWYKPEDFTHDEIATCRRDFFVPYVTDEPHVVNNERSTNGWTANCVGGGTVHMSGYVFRMKREDFTMATRYKGLAELADWPISYDDLAPWYDVVEREVGVSGDPKEPGRAAPYPYPPLAFNPLASLVDDACGKLGLHPFQTPRAIISKPEEGRAACVYCNYCGSHGCEVNAKSSTAASLIPKAIATGNCDLRTKCMAYEVVVKDGRAQAVRYIDETGARHEQKAKLIVVSATAIESARLLLNSKTFPNKAGLVGKHLTFSTLAKTYARFERAKLPEPLRKDHPVHFLQRSLQDDYFLKQRQGEYDKGGTLVFQLAHRNAIYTAEKISRRGQPMQWGAAFKENLYRAYHDEIELEAEAFGEFLPNAGTFVTTSDVKDKWDLPVASIHVAPHAEDRKNSELLAARATDVLQTAGAQKTGVEAIGGTTFVLQHGTCRFGSDPKTSVLDPQCATHDVKNLFVVDGSFMPTSGGVPATLTILANAFRVAAYLVGLRKSGKML